MAEEQYFDEAIGFMEGYYMAAMQDYEEGSKLSPKYGAFVHGAVRVLVYLSDAVLSYPFAPACGNPPTPRSFH